MGLPTHPPSTYTGSKAVPLPKLKMLRLRVLIVLVASFAVGLSVKCWQTGQGSGSSEVLSTPIATSLRSSAVPIVEVTCPNRCMRKWWTVAKVSDVYYSLGCSDNAVQAEKETAKGTGKEGLSYCDKDYCNSSNLASPLVGLLVAALVSVLVH